MKGCIGILQKGISEKFEKIISTKNIRIIPFGEGNLYFVEDSYFREIIYNILDFIKLNQDKNYILTLGDYNSKNRPDFFETYVSFSRNHNDKGAILTCTNTFSLLKGKVSFNDINFYFPFLICSPKIGNLVDSPFGRIVKNNFWYSSSNVSPFKEYTEIASMTSGGELFFWYSENGFQYLATQLLHLKLYPNSATRYIVFEKKDLNSWNFIKLIYFFNKIGVKLIFCYSDNFLISNGDNAIGNIKIYATVGRTSFIKDENDDIFYSNELTVSKEILEAHVSLKTNRGTIFGFDNFIKKHGDFIPFKKKICDKAYKKFLKMLDLYNTLNLDQKTVMRQLFTKKWKDL